MRQQEDTLIKTFCRDCKRDTNHKILHHHKTYSEEKVEDFYESYELNIYMIVGCGGCNTISFCLFERGSNSSIKQPVNYDEEIDDEVDGEYLLITSYPNLRNEDGIEFLKDDFQYELPREIDDLYEEVKSAFSSDSPSTILAGVGLRILVEAICQDQNIKGDNLKVKIENLSKEGFISINEAPILDKLRLIGNVSAHEIKNVDLEYLEYALGIINHVLISIYVLPEINKKLDRYFKPKKKRK